ncbi:glycosyl transferase [Tetzosporium hominis]|uniref:Glycosyl transferase n=1 Tax=Tetzosporium hominis TaxID=2020506 RepID=A0A264W234_9BACL|nr:GT4 family glycosyltransferase PelF [Tetzosporium hominis]OZS77614.1 glycosyl transferase [Tetzosporium hominis]
MRICVFVEGAYPRTTGGVSSWLQYMMEQMPHHQFIVYSIAPKQREELTVKYPPPPNLVELREIYLEGYLDTEPTHNKRYKLTHDEKQAIYQLIAGEPTDWTALFDLFRKDRIDSIPDFLVSKDFYDIVYELCSERFPYVPFTDMFWSLRSMLLPLFVALDQDIPEADIYHAVSTGYAGVLGSAAKHRYQKPLILTEHGIYTREREEEIIKARWIQGYFKDIWIHYFYNLSSCTYTYADTVTSLFEKNRRIQMDLGCPPEKTKVIENGVDIARYGSVTRKRKPGFHVGAVVRIVPIKDIKTMLQSFARVQQMLPESHFYLIGPNDEDKEYYEECLLLGEALSIKNLHYTGNADVRTYFEFIDVLVLSSISEGQPLVILEAFAAGIPVVATDVGACRELIEGAHDEFGHAGAVVPLMHYQQMAHQITRILQSSELQITYGLAGKERVRARYRIDQMIENYDKLYLSQEVKTDGRNRISAEGAL